MPLTDTRTSWFTAARFGMFIHYGLFSLPERGEWVLNREQIPIEQYRALDAQFTAEHFDAEYLCDLAVRAGMRYVVFTTMHHDGFRLYDSALSDFNSVRACGRDLTAEIIAAARKRDLRIGLYHSLNDWTAQPDAVAALEDAQAYEAFISTTHERIRELVTRYNPIDTLWYDGWWPYNAEGWRAEAMNAMVREIQPHILFNGRNGLPGDFSTPEGHLSTPTPWRPWEACMTLNNSWGYHRGDHDWKTSGQVADMLATVAAGCGNLLLNVGPRGDGAVPPETVRVFEEVGDWLKRCGECIFDTEPFTYDLREPGGHRGDWCSHGPFTARGNSLYLLARRWPGSSFAIGGLQCNVNNVYLLGEERAQPVAFTQQKERVLLSGLPDAPPDALCPVLRFDCDRPPVMYLCGGMRTPRTAHPHYDPCPSDMMH